MRILTGLTFALALLSWTAVQVAREHDGEKVVYDYGDPEARAGLMTGGSVDFGDRARAIAHPDVGAPTFADLEHDGPTSRAEWGSVQDDQIGMSMVDGALCPGTA